MSVVKREKLSSTIMKNLNTRKGNDSRLERVIVGGQTSAQILSIIDYHQLLLSFMCRFDRGLRIMRRSAHRSGYKLQPEIKSDETFAVRFEARL